MSPDQAPDPAAERRAFGRTLTMVLLVQVITLLLLWVLQARYAA